MSAHATAELLAAGGAALGRRAWGEAEEAYGMALAQEESPDALEGLAVARWWQDDVDAAIAAREQAYALRRSRGEVVEAARVAGFLAWDYGAMRGIFVRLGVSSRAAAVAVTAASGHMKEDGPIG